MIGDVALVYDWCFDKVTPAQRTRWLAYANQAVWNVWHPTQAKWGSTTFAVERMVGERPVGQLLLLVPARDDAGRPRGQGRGRPGRRLDRRSSAMPRSSAELIPTFNADLVGGGSREGTGYGVAMRRLFELYDFWSATTGESLATKTKHTRASMLSSMHQLVPTLDRVAPTGDLSRDSTAAFFDYHRNYLQELVQLYPERSALGSREDDARGLERACDGPGVHDRRTTSCTTTRTSRRRRSTVSARRTTRRASASSTRARAGTSTRRGST